MGKSITDMSSVTTVGLDLAKHVFQVHGVDASGRVVVAKAIRRNKLLDFLRFAAALPGGARGLRIGALLDARVDHMNRGDKVYR
jgi:transposase